MSYLSQQKCLEARNIYQIAGKTFSNNRGFEVPLSQFLIWLLFRMKSTSGTSTNGYIRKKNLIHYSTKKSFEEKAHYFC